MPKPETPIDEKFTANFINNGGKFLYSVGERDLKENFRKILLENDWGDEVCCFESNLKSLFNGFGLVFSNNLKAPVCLLSCEFLVANTGSILLSSNQIGEKRLSDLPYNFIVLGRTSQLVHTPSDGLRIINNRKQGIPTNITTIKNFSKNIDKDEYFMNYGSVSKNLYLLLLEDL